jgi:hypothetical protein
MDPNSDQNVVIKRQRKGILGRWIRSIAYNLALFHLSILYMVKYYDEDAKTLGMSLYVAVYIWTLIFIFMIPLWTLFYNFTDDPSALPLNKILGWMGAFLGVYSIILFGFYGIQGFTKASITIYPSIYALISMLVFFVIGIYYLCKYCGLCQHPIPLSVQESQGEARV